MHFFYLSAMVLSMFVVSNLYVTITRVRLLSPSAPPTHRRRLLLFCAAAYGIPLVATLMPLIGGRFGDAGGWCWVVQSPQDWLYRILAFYAIIFIGIVYNLVVCGLILRHVLQVRRAAKSIVAVSQSVRQEAQMRGIALRFVAYPLISAFVWSFATAHRILGIVRPGESVFALSFAHTISTPLQGFLDSIVFAVSMHIRRWWRDRKSARQQKQMPLREMREVRLFPPPDV